MSCVKGSGWGGKRAGAGRKRDPLVADRRRRKEQLRIATALLELALDPSLPAREASRTVAAKRMLANLVEPN